MGGFFWHLRALCAIVRGGKVLAKAAGNTPGIVRRVRGGALTERPLFHA